MAHEIKFEANADGTRSTIISVLAYKFEVQPANTQLPLVEVEKLFDSYLSDSELSLLFNQLRIEHQAMTIYLIKITRLI